VGRRAFVLVLAFLIQPVVSTMAQQGDRATASAAETLLPGGGAGAPTPPEDIWTRYWLTGDWNGLRLRLQDAGLKLEAVSINDIMTNPTGGVHQGITAQTFTKFGFFLDLYKIVGWPGATLYASASEVAGRGISTDHLDNILTVTDIEARRGPQIYKAWLEQQLLEGRLSIRAGIEEPGDDFARHRWVFLFANASFAFPALGYDDIQASPSNFPLAHPGLRLRTRYRLNSEIQVLAAVFEGILGKPTPPQSNGLLTIAEVQYEPAGGTVVGLPATFKLGGWHQTGSFADFRFDNQGTPLAAPTSTGSPLLKHGDVAVYGVADQMLWTPPGERERGIGMFARVMAAPGDRNFLGFYVDGGLAWRGPFPDRQDDRVGLAVGHGRIGSAIIGLDQDIRAISGMPRPVRNAETVIELTYQVQLAPWWTVQPDLQYVIHPAANTVDPSDPTGLRAIRDAAVFGLRTVVIF
jgi:porin